MRAVLPDRLPVEVHVTSALTRNLGLVMRKLLGVGTLRGLQGATRLAAIVHLARLATSRLSVLARVAYQMADPDSKTENKTPAPFAIAA